jgi:hypothetical protein
LFSFISLENEKKNRPESADLCSGYRTGRLVASTREFWAASLIFVIFAICGRFLSTFGHFTSVQTKVMHHAATGKKQRKNLFVLVGFSVHHKVNKATKQFTQFLCLFLVTLPICLLLEV